MGSDFCHILTHVKLAFGKRPIGDGGLLATTPPKAQIGDSGLLVTTPTKATPATKKQQHATFS